MALTLRDNLYKSTSSSIWVCMGEGRFLVSKKGRTGWSNKSSAALAFKSSSYWNFITFDLKKQHEDRCVEYRWGLEWKDRAEGEKLEKEIYQKLIEDGTVKYIEIKQVPEWANI